MELETHVIQHGNISITLTANCSPAVSGVEAAGVAFLIRPCLRFKQAPGEQWTMFFKDPSNNVRP